MKIHLLICFFSKEILSVKLYFCAVQKTAASTSMIKLFRVVRTEHSDIHRGIKISFWSAFTSVWTEYINTYALTCIFSILYVFGLKTEICRVNICIQLECVKTKTRKTSNTDTFYALVSIGTFQPDWISCSWLFI